MNTIGKNKKIWEKEVYYQIIEDSHKNDNFENDFIINKIKDIVVASSFSNILDVGCGEGGVLNYFSKSSSGNMSYCGIDISETGISRAKQRGNKAIEYKTFNGETIPYKDNYFDLSFSTFVFEHLSDPKKIFNEMTRVTKNKGNILIACPNYGSPFFRSPCNKIAPGRLMFKRLIQGFQCRRIFKDNFNWDEVDPIKLNTDEHIMDYDTLVEPNLLFFKKYLLNHKTEFEIVFISSFWRYYKHEGKNVFKKIFLNVIKTLGKLNLPVLKYYGPYFFVLLRKK